jgi:membrane protein
VGWGIADRRDYGIRRLQDALDRIWRAPSGSARLGDGFLFGCCRSDGARIGFMLIVSLIVSAALAALGKWWGLVRQRALLANVVNVCELRSSLMFATIYKWMPRVKSWRDVWIGAALTSLLFTVGRTLVGLTSVAVAWRRRGASLVVLWSGCLLADFHAEGQFTWVYAAPP